MYILPNPIVVVLIFFFSFYTSSGILVDHRFHGCFSVGPGIVALADAGICRMPPFFFVLPSSLGKRV